MANELMIPLLPCASIDTIRDLYLPLGFTVGYRQVKPNPYVVLEREDLVLHYFGMDGFEPENSYGSCLVIADSKGDVRQAARILESTLTRHAAGATIDSVIEAQVFLAELFIRLDDQPSANALLDAVAAAELSAADRERLRSVLDQAADLRGR